MLIIFKKGEKNESNHILQFKWANKKELESRFIGDFYRIKGKIKIPKVYIFQLLYLGMFSTLNLKLDYTKIDVDFDKYDEIILASPVWAFTIAPFMKKYLSENKFENKKVTLLITHEGAPGKALNSFKKRIHKSNQVVCEYNLKLGSAYMQSNFYRKNNKENKSSEER